MNGHFICINYVLQMLSSFWVISWVQSYEADFSLEPPCPLKCCSCSCASLAEVLLLLMCFSRSSASPAHVLLSLKCCSCSCTSLAQVLLLQWYPDTCIDFRAFFDKKVDTSDCFTISRMNQTNPNTILINLHSKEC